MREKWAENEEFWRKSRKNMVKIPRKSILILGNHFLIVDSKRVWCGDFFDYIIYNKIK